MDKLQDVGGKSTVFGPIVGVGTDICAVARIEAVLAKYGAKFYARVVPEVLPENRGNAAWLARRFALKEAVSKALGTGIGATVGFADIMLTGGGREGICVRLSPAAQARLGLGALRVQASISGDAGLALAFAVVGQQPNLENEVS